MPNNPIPQHEVDQAVALVKECDGNVKAASRRAGISYSRFYSRYRRGTEGKEPGKMKGGRHKSSADDCVPPAELKEQLKVEGDDDSQVITSQSGTVRTLGGALKAAKVDLAIWSVERFVVNKWDVGAK